MNEHYYELDPNDERELLADHEAGLTVTLERTNNLDGDKLPYAQDGDIFEIRTFCAVTGEWRIIEGLDLADALGIAHLIAGAVEAMQYAHDKTKREAMQLMELDSQHSCCECENEAEWCIECAQRVVHQLDKATFTDERPWVPVTRDPDLLR